MLETSKPIQTAEIQEFPVEERFIKLPIENFLALLGIEPTDPQVAIVNAINDPRYRFIVACISRRLGKTYIANIIGNLVTLYPNSHVLIMSPNYSLSSISWDLQKLFLKKFDIPLTRANAKDKILELENGSTIRMGSVSQADSVVGRSYDLIIFDEAALDSHGRDAFNIQLRPTLDKENSKAIFISTPRGKNYFYDFFNYGYEYDDWISIHADYKENPRVKQKDIDSAKKTMSTAEFEQEYLASFVAMQGKIYNFDVANVLVREIEVVDTIIGMDLGFRDPTAIVVCQTDQQGWHIVECWQENGLTTSQYAEKLKLLVDKWDVDFVYIDSANQQMRHDFAVEHDLFCINAKKDVNLGIGHCQGLIENNLVTIDPSCVELLEVLEYYAWDPRATVKEKPVHDKYSHLADAMRYALYSHAHMLIKDDYD